MSRIALVTGGGSGIGKACATKLAENGYSVVVTGRKKDALDTTVAEMGGGLAVACDETDPQCNHAPQDEEHGSRKALRPHPRPPQRLHRLWAYLPQRRDRAVAPTLCDFGITVRHLHILRGYHEDRQTAFCWHLGKYSLASYPDGEGGYASTG